MCDISAFNDAILFSEGFLIASIAAIIIAAALNSGFFSASGSPVVMLVAAAAAASAVIALKLAIDYLDAYFLCSGSPSVCLGDYNNLMEILTAISVTVGLLATACVAAAIPALIPFLGQAPMYTILIALGIQLALIPGLLVYTGDFVACMNTAVSEWVFILGAVIIITVLIIVAPVFPKLLGLKKPS